MALRCPHCRKHAQSEQGLQQHVANECREGPRHCHLCDRDVSSVRFSAHSCARGKAYTDVVKSHSAGAAARRIMGDDELILPQHQHQHQHQHQQHQHHPATRVYHGLAPPPPAPQLEAAVCTACGCLTLGPSAQPATVPPPPTLPVARACASCHTPTAIGARPLPSPSALPVLHEARPVVVPLVNSAQSPTPLAAFVGMLGGRVNEPSWGGCGGCKAALEDEEHVRVLPCLHVCHAHCFAAGGACKWCSA